MKTKWQKIIEYRWGRWIIVWDSQQKIAFLYAMSRLDFPYEKALIGSYSSVKYAQSYVKRLKKSINE